jgi:5-methyltetrahydropteroyltriglutamate--homocysteine methyltransferase
LSRDTDRILTTHAGSLPRPEEVLPFVLGQGGERADSAALVRSAVERVVRRQQDSGIDILNDGEVGKASYMTYATERLTGFGGEGGIGEATGWMGAALREFPDFAAQLGAAMAPAANMRFRGCDGPVSYFGHGAVRADIANLQAASGSAATFMSSASPGLIAQFSPNRHYASEEDYLGAIAEAMRTEYRMIHEAGFTLQLDCPDLAMVAPGFDSMSAFRRHIRLRVEALNHALAGIPAEAVRMHVCWGGGELPRTTDVELHKIIDILLEAKPAGLMLMASNGRHSHEWQVFEDVRLPDGKYLIPGVVDSARNVVEHPEGIAHRITQYAHLVGRDNVMAGTDCGFSNIAGMEPVVPTVVWAKFRAMAEGAALATARLWP